MNKERYALRKGLHLSTNRILLDQNSVGWSRTDTEYLCAGWLNPTDS
jgi:hypothetical protein